MRTRDRKARKIERTKEMGGVRGREGEREGAKKEEKGEKDVRTRDREVSTKIERTKED